MRTPSASPLDPEATRQPSTEDAPSSSTRRHSFVLEPDSIPVGVRCVTCGRIHFGMGLVVEPPAPSGDDDVTLRCSKCGATASMSHSTLDPLVTELLGVHSRAFHVPIA